MNAAFIIPRAAHVPIGAADLKASARRLMRRALSVSCALHIAWLGLYLAGRSSAPPVDEGAMGRSTRVVTLPPLRLFPPAPPAFPSPAEIRKPADGTPVPVPGWDPSMSDLRIPTSVDARGGSGGRSGPETEQEPGVVPAEDLPPPGKFVYYEEEPVPIRQVQPVYPDIAREAQVQGRVVLHVLVGKDGRVKDVNVIRSVKMLDEAAVDAIRQWIFRPARSGDTSVAVWVEVPVDFRL